jgi:Major Facilitator Superfamily
MPAARWVMIFMCCLANTNNYIDRGNLAGADPHRRGAQVRWADALPAAAGRRQGRRAYPSMAKVAANWLPRKERVLNASIFDSGSRIGAALSLPFVAWLIAAFSWETSCVVTGLLGILWAVLWVIIYRDPEHHSSVTSEQLSRLQAEYSYDHFYRCNADHRQRFVCRAAYTSRRILRAGCRGLSLYDWRIRATTAADSSCSRWEGSCHALALEASTFEYVCFATEYR